MSNRRKDKVDEGISEEVEREASSNLRCFFLSLSISKPKIHPSLLALKDTKALLLPHVGTLTLETQTEMEAVCLRNILKGLETGKMGFVVNEQKGLF